MKVQMKIRHIRDREVTRACHAIPDGEPLRGLGVAFCGEQIDGLMFLDVDDVVTSLRSTLPVRPCPDCLRCVVGFLSAESE